MEFAECSVRMLCTGAKSCGGHFREEFQTLPRSQRDDQNFAYARRGLPGAGPGRPSQGAAGL